MIDGQASTLVLALGNPLMGDDGVGAVVLGRLQEWDWGLDVSIVDGETWGLRLLPDVEAAERLLVIDAIDAGAAPGAVIRISGDELPRRLDTAVSSHQVGLRDVLALADLRGRFPRIVIAIGVQPAVVEFGATLSSAVRGAVETVVAAAANQLQAWGHTPRSQCDVPIGA